MSQALADSKISRIFASQLRNKPTQRAVEIVLKSKWANTRVAKWGRL